jgi:hypothetical protein
MVLRISSNRGPFLLRIDILVQDPAAHRTSFLTAMRPEPGPNSRLAKMNKCRGDAKGILALDTVRESAKSKDEQINHAVRVLERLA